MTVTGFTDPTMSLLRRSALAWAAGLLAAGWGGCATAGQEAGARIDVAAVCDAFGRDLAAAVRGRDDQAAATLFFERLRPALVQTAAWPAAALPELRDYIRRGPDGAGQVLAAFTVMARRRPADALLLIEQGRDEARSPMTRYWCLATAAGTLGLGSSWLLGDIDDAAAVAAFADGLAEFAQRAVPAGLGHAHAQQLRELYDRLVDPADQQPGLGLALDYAGAALIGRLDLRDHELLRPLLRSAQHEFVARRIVGAVSLAANRDFAGPVVARYGEAGVADHAAMHREIVQQVDEWWSAHCGAQVARDWPRLVALGFAELGVDPDALAGPASLRGLRRALRAESLIHRYNAARLLNHIGDAGFDLDLCYLVEGYAMHPVRRGVPSDAAAREAPLIAHWERWIDARLAARR